MLTWLKPAVLVTGLLFCQIAMAAEGSLTAAAGDVMDECREGTVLFKIPAGWKRNQGANPRQWIYLSPTDLAKGRLFEVRISQGFELEGAALKEFVAKDIETTRNGTVGYRAGQVNEFKNPHGYESLMVMQQLTIQGREQLWLSIYLKAVDRVHVAVVAAENGELGKQYGNAAQALVEGLRFSNAVVLAEGKRPLTLSMVYDVTDFFEWLLDVPLTPQQRLAMEQALTEAWKKDNAMAMAVMEQMDAVRKQIEALPEAQRAAMRVAAAPMMAEKYRNTQGVTKMLADIYDAGHKPLVAGDPPLTRQAADASLELVYFMAGQVAGGWTVTPTQEQKDRWATALASRFVKMNPEERKSVSMMPLMWAATQAGWPETPAAQREQLKQQWAKIENVKQVAESINQMRQQAQKTAPAGNNAADNQAAYLKAMRDLQNRQLKTQMIANMMTMQHQTRMAIINNITSTPWRYEYRYVYRPR